MTLDRVIEKYAKTVKSDVFVRYEKDFADKMLSALSKNYLKALHEPSLVQVVEGIVNSVQYLNAKGPRLLFELTTKSIFIHGNKSQVQFNYYGKSTNSVELGDLIFILSVVYNGTKYLEKLTINQFKKDKRKSRSISWNISNKKQLYLLSRFPTFRGVRGLIPKKEYDLPNYSGCLGSYGLIHKPGDFAFVSATRLDSFMGCRKTLKFKELSNLIDIRFNRIPDCCPIFYPTFRHILGNCHISYDVYKFIDEYLRASVGEPVFAKIGLDNSQARTLLHDLLTAVKTKAKRAKSKRMLNFVESFRKFPYPDKGENRSNEDIDFDPEGGGIGIIHTTIDLIE